MLRRAQLCHSVSSVCLDCLSIHDFQVPWSHRSEYLKNNFIAEWLKVPAHIDPHIGDLLQQKHSKIRVE